MVYGGAPPWDLGGGSSQGTRPTVAFGPGRSGCNSLAHPICETAPPLDPPVVGGQARRAKGGYG